MSATVIPAAVTPPADTSRQPPSFASARRALFWAGITVLCAWVLVPIYLLTLGAFGGRRGVYVWPKSILPENLTFEAFATFMQTDGLWSAFFNSLGAAAITVVLSILLGAPAGYALARFNFPGKDGFRVFVLLTRAFPLAILALPLTVSFIRLGLYDTIWGVGLVHTVLALPFAALVTQGIFMGVPRELEEAAWVFGCSKVKAFFKVVLPLALPGFAATAVFAFVISWNEVFAASVLTVTNKTLTAFLLTVLGESPMHLRFAGGLLLIIPSVVFIFAVRRYLFAIWGISSK